MCPSRLRSCSVKMRTNKRTTTRETKARQAPQPSGLFHFRRHDHALSDIPEARTAGASWWSAAARSRPASCAGCSTRAPTSRSSRRRSSPEIAAAPVDDALRPFEPSDLDGVWFVVAAAPPEVNREVAAAAHARGMFVNAVDDVENASAYAARSSGGRA